MGIVTDANRRPIIYDHTKTNFTVKEGIIIAKNKRVYDISHKRVEEKFNRTINDIHEEIKAEAEARKLS
jgi:hypothetical protein